MEHFRLYSNLDNKETYFETWGASTKHPDVMYRFSDYEDRNAYSSIEALVFQWIVFCASRQFFPFHTVEILDWILDIYAKGKGILS